MFNYLSPPRGRMNMNMKEKMGKRRRTFTSHVYLENTHFKSLWSNIYQHFTKSVFA